jgi:hypothetical protein
MYHFSCDTFEICEVFGQIKTTWFCITVELSLIYGGLEHVFKYDFLPGFVSPFSRFLALVGDHVAVVVGVQYLEIFYVLMFEFLHAEFVFIFWLL